MFRLWILVKWQVEPFSLRLNASQAKRQVCLDGQRFLNIKGLFSSRHRKAEELISALLRSSVSAALTTHCVVIHYRAPSSPFLFNPYQTKNGTLLRTVFCLVRGAIYHMEYTHVHYITLDSFCQPHERSLTCGENKKNNGIACAMPLFFLATGQGTQFPCALKPLMMAATLLPVATP